MNRLVEQVSLRSPAQVSTACDLILTISNFDGHVPDYSQGHQPPTATLGFCSEQDRGEAGDLLSGLSSPICEVVGGPISFVGVTMPVGGVPRLLAHNSPA